MQAIVKELSERELAALGAAVRAIDDAAATQVVLVTFVRRFQAGRIRRHGDQEICRVRLVLGFRRQDSDVTGTADVTVDLVHSLIADAVKLCHHYFVWVPYDVELVVRGDIPVALGTNRVRQKIGNSEWRWYSRVYEKRRA